MRETTRWSARDDGGGGGRLMQQWCRRPSASARARAPFVPLLPEPLVKLISELGVGLEVFDHRGLAILREIIFGKIQFHADPPDEVWTRRLVVASSHDSRDM